MITVDLRHLSSPLLCKAADWWAWAMQGNGRNLRGWRWRYRAVTGGGWVGVAAGNATKLPLERPARLTLYFTLGLCLFGASSYQEVIRQVTAGLAGRLAAAGWAVPATTALSAARARLGEAPLQSLFRRLCSALSPGRAPWSPGRAAGDGVGRDHAGGAGHTRLTRSARTTPSSSAPAWTASTAWIAPSPRSRTRSPPPWRPSPSPRRERGRGTVPGPRPGPRRPACRCPPGTSSLNTTDA